MKSIFNLDNPVHRFLSRVFDIAYLNILCLICCIPVFTIGSSVAALYYCLLKIARDQDSSVTEMFFSSFKTNLKQGVLMTMLFGAIAVILVIDLRLFDTMDLELADYIRTFTYVVLVVFAVTVSYAFPILAQFDNSIMNILKFSLLLAICNFKYTVLIVLLNAIPVILFLFLPELFILSFPAWLTFGFATIAMINARMFVKIFRKAMPESQEL